MKVHLTAVIEKIKTGIFEMLQCDTWKDIDPDRERFQPILNDALALLKEQQKRIDVLENVRDILTKKINYHNCNTCKAECETRPLPGEYVRTNCMLWTGKDNEDGEQDDTPQD